MTAQGLESVGEPVPRPSSGKVGRPGADELLGGKAEPAPGSAVDGYRGPQVCNIVGITYRQLDYWARTDLLRPSISDARGSGTQRVYSYTDLLQLKVIKQLLDAGVSLRSTRKAIECLRASGDSLSSASLVIADDRSVLAHSGQELFDLLRGGQGVLSIVVGLEKIVSEVAAAITQLERPPGAVAGAPAASAASR
ncbi:MAG TPA: MerR family transcriptional regulator [Acidimicrobiales bacterium]|nr:MerR family transcriptional regulator [Acidimicrobiales bacterium]